MTTIVATTLKISGDLKRRVVAAAKAADKSPHAFMLEAIEHQTRLDEERRAFVADALAARSEALKSGEGYAAADVHRYVAARARGRQAARPKIRTWRK
jgi:predicted transcriptional regulator